MKDIDTHYGARMISRRRFRIVVAIGLIALALIARAAMMETTSANLKTGANNAEASAKRLNPQFDRSK